MYGFENSALSLSRDLDMGMGGYLDFFDTICYGMGRSIAFGTFAIGDGSLRIHETSFSILFLSTVRISPFTPYQSVDTKMPVSNLSTAHNIHTPRAALLCE